MIRHSHDFETIFKYIYIYIKDNIKPQHIHDVVPFQIKKFKMFPRTWVTSFEIFKFYYWVCFNSDQNQKN